MPSPTADYLATLCDRFGRGWNRFWLTPADPINLAVLRIGAGLAALWLHFSYSFDLVQFFERGGWLPIETIRTLEAESWRFSYLDFLVQPSELWAAHLAGGIVLLLFTLGCWTRVMSCLSALVVLSYVHRAPMLTSQVEPVLTMLLLYLCLGPAGASLSIDRWRIRRRNRNLPLERGAAARPSVTANLALRLIQVHLAMFYAMMGLCKLWGDAWWAGSGIWFLLARPDSRLVDWTGLAEYTLVINAWSHAIVLYELAFSLLIWIPLARPLLLAMGLVIWTSLALVTGGVAWAATMLVANLAFASPGWLHSWSKAGNDGPAGQQPAESAGRH